MKPSLPGSWRHGALLLLLPALAQAAVNFFNPRVPASIPATISQAGIYADIPSKTLDTALKYFEVNAPLWSDGAVKNRWIVLKPGRKIPYQDTVDLFTYPDSTIFVKNFTLRRVDADPSTEVLWETRLLVNKNDSDGRNHWYGFSYKWNDAGTEAVLVPNGANATFLYYPGGLSAPQSYKKWRFPSTLECNQCHPNTLNFNAGINARGVAGFFPVQLKRAAPLNPSINQVQWLFDQGVFMGTAPVGQALARRWKGLTEFIPTGPEDFRFRVIDSIARSYIGANCTSCHGVRGIEAAGTVPIDFNFDWWDFKPRIEFGAFSSSAVGLTSTDSTIELNQPSRYKYQFMASRNGLNTSPGSLWYIPVPSGNETVNFITAGHPALSALLYRQLGARNSSHIDSVEMRRNLILGGDPYNRASWIFSRPWGSAPWRDSLAAHGLALDSVISYDWDPAQMPRLATYIPDTSAMRVLGEWAKSYRTLVRVPGQDSVVNVRGRMARIPAEAAYIRNRVLIVPPGWTGKAQMFSLGGRAYPLASVGRGRYALPQAAPSGVYFFKVGGRTFRASVLK